eukprot:scaffold1959_cov403-Prasinococcus_capsulatus_cf.AAC.3
MAAPSAARRPSCDGPAPQLACVRCRARCAVACLWVSGESLDTSRRQAAGGGGSMGRALRLLSHTSQRLRDHSPSSTLRLLRPHLRASLPGLVECDALNNAIHRR